MTIPVPEGNISAEMLSIRSGALESLRKSFDPLAQHMNENVLRALTTADIPPNTKDYHLDIREDGRGFREYTDGARYSRSVTFAEDGTIRFKLENSLTAPTWDEGLEISGATTTGEDAISLQQKITGSLIQTRNYISPSINFGIALDRVSADPRGYITELNTKTVKPSTGALSSDQTVEFRGEKNLNQDIMQYAVTLVKQDRDGAVKYQTYSHGVGIGFGSSNWKTI